MLGGGDCNVIFGGGNGGGGSGGSGEGNGGDGRGNCGWEEGPASGWVFSGHIFFAAPSPLSLLLFRFVDVSISSASGGVMVSKPD